jgi:hypothetical protein
VRRRCPWPPLRRLGRVSVLPRAGYCARSSGDVSRGHDGALPMGASAALIAKGQQRAEGVSARRISSLCRIPHKTRWAADLRRISKRWEKGGRMEGGGRSVMSAGQEGEGGREVDCIWDIPCGHDGAFLCEAETKRQRQGGPRPRPSQQSLRNYRILSCSKVARRCCSNRTAIGAHSGQTARCRPHRHGAVWAQFPTHRQAM